MWIGWAKAPSLDEIVRICARPQESFAFKIERVPADWSRRETRLPYRIRLICPNGYEFYAMAPARAGVYPVRRFLHERSARREARALVAKLNRLSVEMFLRAHVQRGTIAQVRA